MTDRELLEAAARTSGIKALLDPNGVLRNCTGMRPDQNIFSAPYWNPLISDADALQLAVARNIGVQCHVYNGSGYVLAQCGQGDNEAHAITIEPGDDPCEATRRAIVCVAAAMAQAHQ